MPLKSKQLTKSRIGVVLLLGAVTARAETTICTSITTQPYTISNSGIYCLV